MRFIDYIRKIFLKFVLYFEFFKFLKGKKNNVNVDNVDNMPDVKEEKVLLKFNQNNLQFLEWINHGGMQLPVYYFIKDGKKYHYLNFYDKTIEVNGEKQRMFIADRSLTTIN